MAICVEIEIDDAGNVTVGTSPPGDDANEPKENMQPVENIEVALAKAKALLSHNPVKPVAPAAPKSMHQGMSDAMFPPKQKKA